MASSKDTNETTETFEKRMFGTVQAGFSAVSIAVGSATGLFNTMATFRDAKTSREIADAAGLKERYVREWLGAMVVAGIVEVNSDDDTYYLPVHRHNTLCTRDGAGVMAVMCEGIPMVCELYKEIVNCFQKDGPNGVPYHRYTLHPPWTDALATRSLKDRPPVFLTNNEEIKSILETSSVVCDVGCGSGAALCYLARDFPNCEFHGIDMAEKPIAAAKCRASNMELTNVTFHLGDAIKMAEIDEFKMKFDLIYCVDVIHDVGRPDKLLSGIKNLIKDDGYFLMKDIAAHTKHADNLDHPWAPFLYTISLFRCMPTSLSCGADSFGLGAMWGREKALEMLTEAGFECFLTGRSDLLNYCKKNN